MNNDPINPQHYKHLPAEAIEIIEAAIAKAPSNKAAYLHGQVLKYLLRCWEKKGIEDLRKAKWYLDWMVGQSGHTLAEGLVGVWTPDDRTLRPSKTQPPTGYRLLGPAKDEPRIEGDQYWSLAIKGWTVLTSHKVEYANRDDWTSCRKIETPIRPTKRYREPTKDDLANGAIACQYRDNDDEQWRSGLLVYILSGSMRFLCTNEDEQLSGQWEQCRIEVAE